MKHGYHHVVSNLKSTTTKKTHNEINPVDDCGTIFHCHVLCRVSCNISKLHCPPAGRWTNSLAHWLTYVLYFSQAYFLFWQWFLGGWGLVLMCYWCSETTPSTQTSLVLLQRACWSCCGRVGVQIKHIVCFFILLFNFLIEVAPS